MRRNLWIDKIDLDELKDWLLEKCSLFDEVTIHTNKMCIVGRSATLLDWIAKEKGYSGLFINGKKYRAGDYNLL